MKGNDREREIVKNKIISSIKTQYDNDWDEKPKFYNNI